uniref:Uncharacterized protein n=1 Tax=Acrobeloides nanus TaxID=290746 RepID=A0A914EJE4_9BILA
MAGYIILLLIVPFISVSFLGVNAQLTACNTSSTCIANPQCGLNSAFSCNDTIFLCSSGFSAPDTTANKVDPGCNATSNATLCPYSCGYCCAVSSTNSTTNSTTASPTTASSVTCGSDSR